MLKLVLFSFFFVFNSAYVFDCLDQCECDTEDEIIHCHDGKRTELTLPTGNRLRGFPIIGVTYNNIVRLPDEETLLNKFPDLKVIDIERNSEFDCESVANYDKIKIISDCDKNVSEISKVPRIFRPTKDCDLACQAERHYKKLHEYALQLWEIIKDKYENFDLDATLKQIQEFFKTVVMKVNAIHKDISTRIEQNNREHPKLVTPVPTLEDIGVPREEE